MLKSIDIEGYRAVKEITERKTTIAFKGDVLEISAVPGRLK